MKPLESIGSLGSTQANRFGQPWKFGRIGVGRSVKNFIFENLYQPLGIVCVAVDDDFGIRNNNMNNIGMLTAQEMAKIGNLCLNRGEYQGQRIISEAYLKMATAKQIDASEFVKYFGMQYRNCFREES